MNTEHYQAPWGTALVVLSSVVSGLCLTIAVFAFRKGEGSIWLGGALVALVMGCALFSIRGYTITRDALLIHRVFWTTRLPLAGLQTAQFEPNAMRASLRTFGNGGFFSFTGYYRNTLLGSYRAFVTDLRHTVVLRYADRTIVISPSRPEEFVKALVFSS
jgi:hypothetical protein